MHKTKQEKTMCKIASIPLPLFYHGADIWNTQASVNSVARGTTQAGAARVAAAAGAAAGAVATACGLTGGKGLQAKSLKASIEAHIISTRHTFEGKLLRTVCVGLNYLPTALYLIAAIVNPIFLVLGAVHIAADTYAMISPEFAKRFTQNTITLYSKIPDDILTPLLTWKKFAMGESGPISHEDRVNGFEEFALFASLIPGVGAILARGMGQL